MTEDNRTPEQAAAGYEAALAAEAAELRGDATELDPTLLVKLWPLLRRPIPAAYVQHVGKVEGKPYPSTGVRSVQVQVDRMDAVLTPLGWRLEDEYTDEGKLCRVTVEVLGARPAGYPREVLLSRASYGGVNRGSTVGNVYKGSFTNAAKRALAMIGPGHEIYLGVADLDPDVNPDTAAAQTGGVPAETQAGRGLAKAAVDRAWAIPAAKGGLRLAVAYVTDADPGDCATKAKATAAVAKLTPAQLQRVEDWITSKADGPTDDPADGEAG